MPFQKGQSGNPGGRKREAETLTAALRSCLKSEASRRRVAKVVVDLALAGNMDAIKLVWERMDGKVPLPIQGGDQDKPVRVEHGVSADAIRAAEDAYLRALRS